jgi:hypothetical protein
MHAQAKKAELLRSLGQVVRGLSVLFWSLPVTLLVCVKTASSELLTPFGIVPPLIATASLAYGLWQLSGFQKQERVWSQILDRTKLLSVANVGLSPFVFWWHALPQEPLYQVALGILMVSSLLFLFNLNQVMLRLSLMLPDETLRLETQFFTALNLRLLVALVMAAAGFLALQQVNALPEILIQILLVLEAIKHLVLVFLILLPLAMTMTMIWKIKEAILLSVFEGQD